ncbi:LIM and senescent cell antigen-like-containing domain protein 1 [Anopheles marshallii]|uniref:LIM and senescent cell antigen-like-containing domain protein 1 n=1 Tax=Anopheles marshallii TaxID=1521116 RepID=UPI00237BC9FD|nr:LIM and senescent cell antigen-like-containing domain protein 1 [Anopheles marshallii]
MSALKLKPLEDSNLYKRRTTSKENLLQTVGGLGAVSDMMHRPRPELDGTRGDSQSQSSRLVSACLTNQQQTPPARSPMHNFVSYPQYPQVENYYQQPKSPIRMASGPFATPNTTNASPLGVQKNVQFLTPASSAPSAANRTVYDGSSATQQRRPAVPFEHPTSASHAVTTRQDNATSNVGQQQSPGTYQNLPTTVPATPTTPGRKMESWEQFGRSNLQTVAAGGVTSNNMSLGTMHCTRCDEGFEPHERIVNSNGQLWHTQCFVCAQCFRQFQDGIFYEFEGRKYCEKDFHILFAPCCNKCNNFVIGRVIKAMAANWHPQCFTCERCSIPLADSGFIRNQNRALCHDCNRKEKEVGLGKLVCNKCHGIIDDVPLRFRGEVYHGYHFNCTACGAELDSSAREVKNRSGYAANDMNELYCLRCHDRMGIPICGACRRPIEERVVTALGKHWHVEHFVCAKCEKPFLGHRHYEKRGMAYCETHYHQLFGNLCFVCNQVIAGDVFTALNKAWCVHHFSCSICDQKLDQKSKFFEYDEKPVCKKCYERFPNELRRRLRISHENTIKKPVP